MYLQVRVLCVGVGTPREETQHLVRVACYGRLVKIGPSLQAYQVQQAATCNMSHGGVILGLLLLLLPELSLSHEIIAIHTLIVRGHKTGPR